MMRPVIVPGSEMRPTTRVWSTVGTSAVRTAVRVSRANAARGREPEAQRGLDGRAGSPRPSGAARSGSATTACIAPLTTMPPIGMSTCGSVEMTPPTTSTPSVATVPTAMPSRRDAVGAREALAAPARLDRRDQRS